MIDLKTNICILNLPSKLEYKLVSLGLTKLGYVLNCLPDELLALGFDFNEVNLIESALIKNNIDLSECDLFKFNFDDYQEELIFNHKSYFKGSKFDMLRYTDNINVVNKLYYLYKYLHDDLDVCDKLKLNNFLLRHKGMTISEFLQLDGEGEDAVDLICNILGMPLSSNLEYTEKNNRKNDILSYNYINSATLELYKDMALKSTGHDKGNNNHKVLVFTNK